MPDQSETDRLAAAVTSVPGVAGLHAGSFGEIGTYLPGRVVPGIRVRNGVTEIHLAVLFGAPVRETASMVRRAVAAVTTGPVDVTVEDVVAP